MLFTTYLQSSQRSELVEPTFKSHLNIEVFSIQNPNFDLTLEK